MAPAWARAVTENEFEAAEWLWKVNADRHASRFRKNMGV